MTRTSAENYELDHAIALARGVTVDDIDALPMATVEALRDSYAAAYVVAVETYASEDVDFDPIAGTAFSAVDGDEGTTGGMWVRAWVWVNEVAPV